LGGGLPDHVHFHWGGLVSGPRGICFDRGSTY
jgi:hypothetical protein